MGRPGLRPGAGGMDPRSPGHAASPVSWKPALNPGDDTSAFAWNPPARCRSVAFMSAQPAEPDERHEVIHLGGMEAAIVPIDDYLRLRAIERRASPEAREEAGIEASIAAHERWV